MVNEENTYNKSWQAFSSWLKEFENGKNPSHIFLV
jgi:hypothetical protein